MPHGYRETYSVEREGTHTVHVLAWRGDDGRGYELALDPLGVDLHVVFMYGPLTEAARRSGVDFVATGVLRRGRVVFDGVAQRRMGAAGWLVFERLWARLLAKMDRRRRNPPRRRQRSSARLGS